MNQKNFIPKTILKYLINSYLNSTAQLSYQDYKSISISLSQGVKQGSILSPYLYNFFQIGLQKLINICVEFGKDNNLMFNHSKTQFIISGKSDLTFPLLQLDGKFLLPQDHLKHLGFMWKLRRSSLQLTQHEYRLSEMWAVTTSLISAGVRKLHPHQIVQLFKSLVIPKLLYGVELMDLSETSRINLNRQARSAMKSMFNISKHSKNLQTL